MSSLDSASKFIKKLQIPAMTMSSDFKIVKANDHMSDLLGWKSGELDNCAGHRVNDAFLMSTIAEIHSRPPLSEKEAVHSRYVYVHKTGEKIHGLMSAFSVTDNLGFLIIFYADINNIINNDKLAIIMGNK
jgi:hypothetical protein